MKTQMPSGPSGEFSIKITHLKKIHVNTLKPLELDFEERQLSHRKGNKPSSTRKERPPSPSL